MHRSRRCSGTTGCGRLGASTEEPDDVRTVAVLAHQGGWDEILMVMGPIGLIAGLLRLAKHRVTRPRDDQPDA